MAKAHERAASVYCRGPLLEAVQRSRVFEDGKHFVDMPMRSDPEDILLAFKALPPKARGDRECLRRFVAEHFLEPGEELVPVDLSSTPKLPPFVAAGGLADDDLRTFALALHELWPTLCRVTAPSVAAAPHRNSALPRRHAMVLPGGRFRETYYWDSLWIVHGLLSSGMLSVAKGLVQNLLDDVREFGFVPNGGRVYYLNRSQPPMLHAMVAAVVEHMDAEEEAAWLKDALRDLRREYEWWMAEDGGHVVEVGRFRLNRFYAQWDEPRPESYLEDAMTSAGCRSVCRELASVAETGWDFSSRWSRLGGRTGSSGYCLRTSEVTRVLPVDLNAIMYSFERTLSAISEAVATGERLSLARGRPPTDPDAIAFSRAAARRRLAFDTLFWQGSLGRWVDAWLPEDVAAAAAPLRPLDLAAQGAVRGRAPTLADFAVPLWAGLGSEDQIAQSVDALRRSGLLGPGGAATTPIASGQQWDAPNAWPPLQSMLIEGLAASEAPEAPALALELARRWVGTCLMAWKSTGHMHEKYDADEFGKDGGGGEYEPQVGFGWSNGVALHLMERFGDLLAVGASGFEVETPQPQRRSQPSKLVRMASL